MARNRCRQSRDVLAETDRRRVRRWAVRQTSGCPKWTQKDEADQRASAEWRRDQRTVAVGVWRQQAAVRQPHVWRPLG
eukprot:3077286-Pleurochrysis_carterae.AAC.3